MVMYEEGENGVCVCAHGETGGLVWTEGLGYVCGGRQVVFVKTGVGVEVDTGWRYGGRDGCVCGETRGM